MTVENHRLEEARQRKADWKLWGPYLSERQWGTVREDYSPDGDAWDYFPHDHARSRAYRWGEDGLGGICDRKQYLCFAMALWNGKDPYLKERLFGLPNQDGNHGEDVKEYYYYLDATPTNSYLKFLYKYPQNEFPYEHLVKENRRRNKQVPEYELIETGTFNDDRYFDIIVEYAKADVEDILIRITAYNRGPESSVLHLLPTIWFRNTWSWGIDDRKPSLESIMNTERNARIEAVHSQLGKRWLVSEGTPELLFTENETNFKRFFGTENRTPQVKDGINDFIVHNKQEAINQNLEGTKAAVHYKMQIEPGDAITLRLRLTDHEPRSQDFDEAFDSTFEQRRNEADEFYSEISSKNIPDELRSVQRQAFAGMLWTKQFYYFDVRTWLEGDPSSAPPPPERRKVRNREWAMHLYNEDIISMPDKWEFPWYAAWDLAFHCIPLALVDSDFAKKQLLLFLREWYMHPNGQLPAYEWNFDDVNPPVHAWACWRVYKIEKRIRGKADRQFLEKVFHKLLLNFTWWVNRKDPDGRNLFQGGFLGMDNIGVFDRSHNIPTGGHLEQSDSTSWMAMYCLNMLAIALELAKENPAYEDVASKFFEHFIHIAHAVHDLGGEGIELWDEEDGFYYDVLNFPGGDHVRLKVRSMVGLIPLFATEILEPENIDSLPGFKKRMEWFINNHPDAPEHIEYVKNSEGKTRCLLAISNSKRLQRILRIMFNENEFLSPFGIRSLSRYHKDHPYVFHVNGEEQRVDYEPGESTTELFGGNSNWRGPIWLPVNFLLIESLQKYHHFFGDEFKVECPTGSGNMTTLWEASTDLSCRLIRLFQRDKKGYRPIYGNVEKFQTDPYWKKLILFYEHFNGDNGTGLGANHQTGWTGLVAKLIDQSGEKIQ
jgi:glycogen debranching enzyme